MTDASIIPRRLQELIEEIKEGAEVGAICDSGDKKLAERTSKVIIIAI